MDFIVFAIFLIISIIILTPCYIKIILGAFIFIYTIIIFEIIKFIMIFGIVIIGTFIIDAFIVMINDAVKMVLIYI